MEDSIDLCLRSLHGIGWIPGDEGNDESDLAAIKAYVSFSGSVPNMKVSSFAMCFETGNLVIESNKPEVTDINDEGSEAEAESRKGLDITFADPFSSDISKSSVQPHVQFPLPGCDTEASPEDDGSNSQGQKFLKFHIVFRSVDNSAIAEGVANLEFPENDFESLPLTLDLPIAKATKENSTKIVEGDAPKQIFFEESAFIRVHLQDSSKQQSMYSAPNPVFNELFSSNELDSIKLRGMVKKIHEQDCLTKGKLDMTKSDLFEAGVNNPEGRRYWACGGAVDLRHMLKSFFAGVRGFPTKCADDEVPELLSNPTMESTILTRESLKI